MNERNNYKDYDLIFDDYTNNFLGRVGDIISFTKNVAIDYLKEDMYEDAEMHLKLLKLLEEGKEKSLIDNNTIITLEQINIPCYSKIIYYIMKREHYGVEMQKRGIE